MKKPSLHFLDIRDNEIKFVNVVSQVLPILKVVFMPSPGRPSRSSVHAEHCPVPLAADHFDDKSAKATTERKNCGLCPIFTEEGARDSMEVLCLQCSVMSSA